MQGLKRFHVNEKYRNNSAYEAIVNMMHEVSENDGDYAVAMLPVNDDVALIFALGPNTGGLNIIIIGDSAMDLEEVVATRLLEYVKTTSYANSDIQIIPRRLPPDYGSIWSEIESSSTNQATFEFSTTLPEFQQPELILNPIELVHARQLPHRELDAIKQYINASINSITGHHEITVPSLDYSMHSDELTAFNSWFPFLLIHAAVKWTPIVCNDKNRGAFRIGLSTATEANESRFGYKVATIDVDNLPMLAIAVSEIIKESERNTGSLKTYDISDTIQVARNWLSVNGWWTGWIDSYFFNEG